jgi:perosamine synthetase
MEIKYPVYRPSLKGNERKYVLDCLDTNWISSRGNYIQLFEQKFAEYTHIEHSTSVCNGTAAVLLALMTLDIQPGDEVIVPSLVYVAVPNMVLFLGATPVFVDSMYTSWQMDPAEIRRKITSKTKAIIVVHTYGHPCDMDAISKISHEYGLYLVEDCAEALGSTYKNHHVGHWGHISTYSFFGNKTITTGEGGMVVSRSEELIKKAFHFKNQGVTSKVYWHDVLANNFRMTNITAAIGLAQIERIEEILENKARIAKHYQTCFEGSGYEFHQQLEDVHHSYWMCSILARNASEREPLREQLLAKGIETRPFFYPAQTMPIYNSQPADNTPVTADLSARGLNLPSYPELTNQDVEFISSAVLAF